ncbi:MAG TPA: DUF3788 family protein [Bacteroidales bacterium]|nr:DUF3788 family protein [Bacteroidales bacterium]
MDTILLKDKQVFPEDKVLNAILGDSYYAYAGLIKTVTGDKFGLSPQWNYYNDGKAWLCKVVFKKKTVFWLSVWEGYFKVAFYFTEKSCDAIGGLEIAPEIKQSFMSADHIGKLIPLVVSVRSSDQLPDLYRIIAYKKGLK